MEDQETAVEVLTDQSTIMSDPKSFIVNISSFFNQEALSDITIKVRDQTYHAHKFVLANSSDVLRTMLYEKRWTHSQDETILLNETENCELVFEPFLRFLYTASVQLNLTNVIGILCLADKYNVEALKHICQSYMIDHCKSPLEANIRNALIWYPWSKALHLKCLQNQSQATIAWNAKEIMTSDDWVAMEFDFLQDMLSSSELVTQSEMEIFEAVESWLLYHYTYDKDKFKDSAALLLQLVRFPRMTITELYKVETSNLAKVSEISELLTAQLGKAYRFHSLCMAAIKNIQVEFSDPQYQPRDYLSYQVDSVRIQNTLRYAMQVEVKTCSSPLPDLKRDAEWKLSYRKIASTGTWSLHVQCQDTQMNNTNASYETTVVIYDEDDRIINVVKHQRAFCKRGQAEVVDIPLEDSNKGKNMVVLIKPVVNIMCFDGET